MKKLKQTIDFKEKENKTLIGKLEKEKKEIEKDLDIKKKESLFLTKAVSSDTDALINLNHTITNSTLAIKDIIDDINKKIKDNRPINEIQPLIDEISIENDKIKVLSEFVSLANFNMKTEWLKNKDIIQYISEYLQRIKHQSLKFRFINENIIFKTDFRPLEISIMLDNFITNSKKANATVMTISFESKNKSLQVYVADNGKGIQSNDEKYIFNRGYTTTKGAGIGLHHIKNIMKSLRGNVSFVGNNHNGFGKGACFLLEFK